MEPPENFAIPLIETERLTLRAHRPADFDAYAAMWAEPVVTRYIGGAPLTREQAWQRLLRYRGMWAFVGHGFWAIEDRATGRLAGEAGFLALKRDMTPSLDDSLETGWALAPAFHGRGLAVEAVSAALSWAEANRPGMQVTCIIDPENEASRRVAGKLGFREKAQTTYQGKAIIQFERPAATSTHSRKASA